MKRTLLLLASLFLFIASAFGQQAGRPRRVPTKPATPCNERDFVQADDTHVTSLCQNALWKDVATGAGAGANTALSNLASVAINLPLLPSADNSIAVGSETKRWTKVFLNGAAGNQGIEFNDQTGSGALGRYKWSAGIGPVFLDTGASGKNLTFDLTLLSANRSVFWPNKAGTVAMTSDIPAAGPTNSAGANVIPKSNGTNFIASRVTDAGSGAAFDIHTDTGTFSAGNLDAGVIGNHTKLIIQDSLGRVTMGDPDGQVNSTSLIVDTLNETVTVLSATFIAGGDIQAGGAVSAPSGFLPINAGAGTVGSNTLPLASVYIGSANVNNIQLTGTATSAKVATFPDLTGTVLLDTSAAPLSSVRTSDTTTTSTTVGLTGLTVSVVSGVTYEFTAVLYLSESVAADGAKVEFNGGGISATNFRAHVLIYDTALLVSNQVTALTTVTSVSTMTGASVVVIYGTLTPSTSATFAIRYAQNSHSTGTLTIARGSSLILRKIG